MSGLNYLGLYVASFLVGYVIGQASMRFEIARRRRKEGVH